VLSPNPFISGTHRPEGIFVIAGDGIVKGKRLEMHEIIDVAPTVYYLMGVPIPPGLDGRAIQECFEFGYLAEYAPFCEGNL
jgi:predicted AlkP superfamily phosphohydrolase/phosphomutase